jgi:hypothetical protein
LRKYLIVATAALTAIAFTTAVAVAQAPEATMKVTVKAKKAGTKKKPKNSSIKLNIVNANNKRTLSKLTITSPKTFKLSAKGLTKCAEAVLEAQGPDACPRASKVGGGVAHALAGVNTPNPAPLTFDVTAIVLGPKKIGFHLAGRESPLTLLSPGTISGRKLTIQVPEQAQQLPPGNYNGLVSLETTLKGKKGKNYLASTTGCVAKKHKFSTVLTFVDNPVSDPGTVTTRASSACTK